MARTSVNKAAAVRDYMAKHPEQKPKEVAAAVTAAIKVKVSPNYVSIIKSSSKKKSSGTKAGKISGSLTKAACLYLRASGGSVKAAIAELNRVAEIIEALA